jgi:hypothetical protein
VTGTHRAVGPLLRRIAPFMYLFVVAILAAGVHMAKYTVMSPIDELRHVDYAMRVTKGHFPILGDKLTQEAMREEACRGFDSPSVDPPCRTKVFDPRSFRDDGWQTATAHPPTYYLGAGLFARTAMAVGISDSFLDPARAFSALLFAAGLMVAFAAGRAAGVRASPLLAALTLLPVFPAVLHAHSTVNPDSTAILAGAIVMLVGLGWERGRLPLWTLALAGAFAGGTKYTSLLAVAMMTAVFVVRAEPVELWATWRGARRARKAEPEPGSEVASESVSESESESESVSESEPAPETASGPVRVAVAADVDPPGVRSRVDYVKAAAVLLGAALVVALAWMTIDRMRAVIDPSIVPQNQALAAHGIPPLATFISPLQMFAWLPPWNSYDTARFVTPYVEDVRIIAVYLYAGAVLMAALRVNRRDRISMFGAFGVAASVLGAPAFIAFTVVVSNVVIDAPARYGMSLLPFMAAVVASFVKNRVGGALLWIFALTSYSVVVGTMLVR